MRGAAIILWAQDASEPLRLLLTGAEGARYLDEHIGVWKVDGEVPHLRQNNALQLAVSKPFVDSLSLRLRGFSHDKGSANLLRNSRNLVNILADDEDASFGILSEQFTKVNPLCWIFCRDAELMSSLSKRVLHASLGAHGNSYFDTGSGCNPRLPLEVLPGNIETLGPNESEHVAFSTVFAYERGRETKPSSRLEVRRDSKDRCGQEVHLVVNDEPPRSCRAQLIRLAGRRLTKDGVLVIRAERFRTQEQNRKDARDCLADPVRRATLTLVPRSLIATRSTRASKERRIKANAAKHDSDGGEPNRSRVIEYPAERADQ